MINDIVNPEEKPAAFGRADESQFLSTSLSINNTDRTGRLRLFPPTDATYSLFSDNKLLLDQD